MRAVVEQNVRTTVGNIRQSVRPRVAKTWSKRVGIDAYRTVADDARAADDVAQSLSEQWESARRAAIIEGLGDVEAQRFATEVLAGSPVERAAVTEVASAFNDEILQQNTAAALDGWIVVQTWSSILDVRTCPSCAAMDGTSVELPDRFPEPPPLHPWCRCIVTTDLKANENREAA